MQDTFQNISTHLETIAYQINRPDIVARLRTVGSAQQNNGISLAVVGAIGCGKSTLINTLLEREVLPTGNPLREPGYTIVTISETRKAIVNFLHGEKKTVTPIPATLTNAAQSGSVSSFEIQYTSSQLEKGTRIMEVPGIDPPHQKLLSLILDQANTVIYVIDVHQSLRKEEQAILSNLPSHITRLLIAFTKFDEIAVTEQDETFQRAIQQIEELHLTIKPQIYKLAPQIILKEQFPPTLVSSWEEFKQAILKIPPTLFTIPQPSATQITELSAIVKDLRDTLVQSNTQSASSPSPLSEQQRIELYKTHDLLKRVIADQSRDIEQTIKDSFNAFIFRLGDNNTKNRRFSLDLIESEVNSWLDSETIRLKTRFSRLYKTVLESAGSSLGRELDFAPEILPVSRVQYSTTQMKEVPPSFLASLSREQRSILMGGVAVAVIGGILGGPVGWTLLSAGAGLAGITLYIIVEGRHSGSRDGQLFDKLEITMPEGIEMNILHNKQRLNDFIDKAFREENVAVHVSNQETRTVNLPALEELTGIQAVLERLGS